MELIGLEPGLEGEVVVVVARQFDQVEVVVAGLDAAGAALNTGPHRPPLPVPP
jgi:hypothetical protein